MKILVTGATGFIGAHLVQRLDRLGIHVHSCVGEFGTEYSRERWAYLNPSLEYPKRSFSSYNLEEFDVVVHLAARAGVRASFLSPLNYAEANLKHFTEVISACAKSGTKFLYASSSSVYGSKEGKFVEGEETFNPESFYASTKCANEIIARAYRNSHNLTAIGMRFFTVFGPFGRKDMAPMLFAEALMSGEPIRLFNEGNMLRDFTPVDTIVTGILKLISAEKYELPAYNIGHGSPIKLMEFLDTLSTSLNYNPNIRLTGMQRGDVVSTWACMENFNREFGPINGTDIHHSIREFAKWFKQRKEQNR